MVDRSKFFDDMAGVAGGAMSALAGLREEAESTIRARMEEAIRKFDLVRREDLEAVQEMAANARAAQAGLEARVAALEAAVARLSAGSAGASASAASSSAASGSAAGATESAAFGSASAGAAPPEGPVSAVGAP